MDGVHTEIPIPSSAWDVENETVWLTQSQLAELYKTSVQNVGRHIGNILEDIVVRSIMPILSNLILWLVKLISANRSNLNHATMVSDSATRQ